MSKHINVNPGQYYEGGRERQGEDIVHGHERQEYEQARRGRGYDARAPHIPNQERASIPKPREAGAPPKKRARPARPRSSTR